MATNANLPAGQFITSLGGKRCTAIPKTAPAAAQMTTASPEAPPAASPAAPSPTEALPPVAAPAETVASPPPAAPAEEAIPAATSPIPPPVNDPNAILPVESTPTPAAGDPATQPEPAPSPSPSPQTTTAGQGQDGSFVEAVPSTPSQSKEASPPEQQESDITLQSAPTDTTIDVAPTSTADEPAPAATGTDLGATAPSSDSTVQATPTPTATPTAGGSAAVSTSIPSTLVSSTTALPSAQNTAGLGSPSNGAEADGAAGPTATPFNNTRTTAAVVGGVVGGLAIISLIAFLIFFLRRRSKRRRRSTLLTSMFGDPGFGRGEKGQAVAAVSPSTGATAYTINRTSLGPTPASEKLKNSFVFGYKRFRGRLSNIRSGSPQPNVDLDRGTSQFGPPPQSSSSASSSSRSNSRSRARGYDDDDDDDAPTAKGRLFGWFGRSGEAPKSNRSANEPFAGARAIRRVSNEKKLAPNPQQPDFNTLLRMDEEAAAATQEAGGASGSGAPARRSTGHFLGGLGFDYESAMGGKGASPFSDDNAISLRPVSDDGTNSSDSSSVRHDSATIPPLAFPKGDNLDPFSDANAVSNVKSNGPTTYVQELRRSRSRSATTTSNLSSGNMNYAAAMMARRSSNNNNNRRSSSYGYIGNIGRESGVSSVDSVDDNNNNMAAYNKRSTKFRSDPFDLDRFVEQPSTRAGSGSRDSRRTSSYGGVGVGVRAPPRAGRGQGRTASSRVVSWTSEYSGISEEEDDGRSETALAITTTANTLANARARARAGASVNVFEINNWNTKAGDTSLDGWSEPGPDVGRRPSQGSVGKAM